MNSTSYCSIQNIPVLNEAGKANERATLRLSKAKEILASIEDKMEIARKQISNTHYFINYSRSYFDNENEIIIRCLERLKTLEVRLEDQNVVETNRSDNGVIADENKPLQYVADVSGTQINLNLPATREQYVEIDLKTAAATTFWCKKLNASRPEILEAMEQVKSKSWVNVWKYFLNKKSGNGAALNGKKNN